MTVQVYETGHEPVPTDVDPVVGLGILRAGAHGFDRVTAHKHPEVVHLAVGVELASPVKESGHLAVSSNVASVADVASAAISARPVMTPLIAATVPKLTPTLG